MVLTTLASMLRRSILLTVTRPKDPYPLPCKQPPRPKPFLRFGKGASNIRKNVRK